MGYIGSHTAVSLMNENFEVVIFDNLSNSNIDVLDKIKSITNKKPKFVEGDIRDEKKLLDLFSEHKFLSVIHFAGLKAVSESVQKPLEYFDVNVVGSINLLRVMDLFNVRTFVYSSSATIYGNPNYLPLDESHDLGSLNPYGTSKLNVEYFLKDLADSSRGKRNPWRIACLRYFNPIGAHKSALIGEKPNGIPNNLMPYICQVAEGIREELLVYGNDYETIDGTGVRDYIHVMDLSEGHISAINFLKEHIGYYAFNLGTGKGYSVLEVLRMFELVSGRKIPYRFVERRIGDADACYANVEFAKNHLNWSSKRNLREMCQSSWNYIKNEK